MKRLLISLLTILVVAGLVGGGAFAYFSDTETSTTNTFTAGTLDLKVDIDQTGNENYVDDPNVNFSTIVSNAASNLKPGDSQTFNIGIQNAGSIAGIPTIKLIGIVNDENGLIEPELTLSPADTADTGELGANIDVVLAYNGAAVWSGKLNDFNVAKFPAATTLAANTEAQWDITMSIATSVGNIIQSDKVSFQVVFGLYQDASDIS